MGSLFASLLATAGTLRAYDRSLAVIQNNVSNADSPGYARQRVVFIPRLFEPERGLAGGVEPGPLVSSRDPYVERNVWRQQNLLGRWAQQAIDLEQIEPYFNIRENAGVTGALNDFFNSVSSWSINPNDPVARQVVLDRASAVARAFNENAAALGKANNAADAQLRNIVERINGLTSRIRDFNIERRSDTGKRSDPALDAQIHATLEELSQYADFSVLEQPDGSFTVLFGGQTPLVIGDRWQPLQVDFSFPQPRLLDESGADISWQLNEGALKGLMETRTVLIPSYLGDLNRLAEAFATEVNTVLAAGLDANGATPMRDLFTFDSLVGAAATLATNPLSPAELAAADVSSPGGNQNALRLAALTDAPTIDGVSFHEFYGNLAARLGRDLNRFRENQAIQEQLLSQARLLREERSGVSLDEEAARLIEAQRAYQANARLFEVLNSLTDTLINLLR